MVKNLTISPSYFPPLMPNFYFKIVMDATAFMPQKIKIFYAIVKGRVQPKSLKKIV